MARFSIFADACVLYSAPVCDLLLESAKRRFFRLLWSRRVHAEWMESLRRKRPDLHPEKLRRRYELMVTSFPEAMVEEHEGLATLLELPDEGDRHVLAAAIGGCANGIVTFNIRDFPTEVLSKWDIEPLHPDEFFISQFDLGHAEFLEVVKSVRARLRNPPLDVPDYLDVLTRNQLSGLAAALKKFDKLI